MKKVLFCLGLCASIFACEDVTDELNQALKKHTPEVKYTFDRVLMDGGMLYKAKIHANRTVGKDTPITSMSYDFGEEFLRFEGHTIDYDDPDHNIKAMQNFQKALLPNYVVVDSGVDDDKCGFVEIERVSGATPDKREVLSMTTRYNQPIEGSSYTLCSEIAVYDQGKLSEDLPIYLGTLVRRSLGNRQALAFCEQTQADCLKQLSYMLANKLVNRLDVDFVDITKLQEMTFSETTD